MKTVLLFFVAISLSTLGFAQENAIIHLWPEKVPGENGQKYAPDISLDTTGQVTRVSAVTDPTLTVYAPDSNLHSGAGIIVCPGGGYSILAIDKEGYEIAEWLNELGITAFVLHYRVPNKQPGALQDVQRAIRLIRSRAGEWNLGPSKLGVMGFSAGGSLSARISTLYNQDWYPAVSEADTLSIRPDFSVLMYPAYLDKGPAGSLTPELDVNKDTPPMFIFQTADDPYGKSALVMAGALYDAEVPVELHFYPEGGHGYGLRPGNPAAEAWPGLAEKWFEKILERP